MALDLTRGFAGEAPRSPVAARKRKSNAEVTERHRKVLRKRLSAVCGLDVSSSRLAMVSLTDPPRTLKVEFRQPWVPSVCAHAASEVVAFCAALQNELDWNVDAWIEGALVGRSRQGTIVQAYVNGAVQSALISLGATVHIITPGEWKLEVTGNGGSDKAHVAQRLRQRWPDLSQAAHGDGDLVDAFGVAIAGAVRSRAMGRASALP